MLEKKLPSDPVLVTSCFLFFIYLSAPTIMSLLILGAKEICNFNIMTGKPRKRLGQKYSVIESSKNSMHETRENTFRHSEFDLSTKLCSLIDDFLKQRIIIKVCFISVLIMVISHRFCNFFFISYQMILAIKVSTNFKEKARRSVSIDNPSRILYWACAVCKSLPTMKKTTTQIMNKILLTTIRPKCRKLLFEEQF